MCDNFTVDSHQLHTRSFCFCLPLSEFRYPLIQKCQNIPRSKSGLIIAVNYLFARRKRKADRCSDNYQDGRA